MTTTTTFEALGLNPNILRALTDAEYTTPTEVQAMAIPAALSGRDVRVCSHTGSGKTAAYIIPALERIIAAAEARRAAQIAAGETPEEPAPSLADSRPRRAGPRGRDNAVFKRPSRGPVRLPKVLVLAPTRELAMQVAKAATTYGRQVPDLQVTVAVGGMPYPPQIQALRSSLDILIATPGRLIDHIERGAVKLDQIELLVLDEADRMLDMGFIEDIERIAQSLPAERQTVMVSATFSGNVGRLANEILKPDAQQIEVEGHTESNENIDQHLMWADDLMHKDALLDHLLTEKDMQQAVVFTSTQRDADVLAERLYHAGHAVAPLHGGMPQGRRNRTLLALRRGELRVLIATDVAARGIDVPTISHVINYGLPMKAEDYVHRIGRTGRAGRSGRAVTLAERRDASMIRRIQQFTTKNIPVSTVEGLEPKRPAPQLFMDRRDVGMAPRGGPRSGPGGHRGGPRFGAPSGGRFDSRPSGPSFGHGPSHGHGGDRFEPRRDEQRPAARPNGPRSGPFDPRFEAPRQDRGFDDRAPRFADDRAPRFGAPHGAPHGAPAGARPRPAGPGARPAPQWEDRSAQRRRPPR